MIRDDQGDSCTRVLIADDEPLARKLVARLVDKDPDLQTVSVCADGVQTRREILRLQPDLVFLDVEMPKLNGVEIIEGLLEMDRLPYVVFVTAFGQYAVQAFDVDALDYLMKPVEEERFNVAVARAKNAIQQRRLCALSEQIAEIATSCRLPAQSGEQDYLIVKKGDELVRLQPADILWLEAASQYVKVHTRNGSYLVAESLKNYQRKLPQHLFTRIHRSAVVNRNCLRRVFKKPNGVHALELDDGTVLSLARSRRRLLVELLESCRPESVAGHRTGHG